MQCEKILNKKKRVIMKKITIIICYFGKLPNYYKIWEYSAINNPTINFLLVTDQKIKSKEKWETI